MNELSKYRAGAKETAVSEPTPVDAKRLEALLAAPVPLAPGASAPGAIAAPPSGRSSGGITDFAFLYGLIGGIDTRVASLEPGGAGATAVLSVPNTFTTPQTFGGGTISNTQQGNLQVGTGGFAGGAGAFAGSANGTLIAGNAAAGFIGDLENLEIGGVSKFRVDKDGNIYQNGVLLIAGTGASLSSPNTFTAVNSFCVDDAGQNTITDTLNLCHTYNAGFGTVGQGVGLNFQTETNAALETIAQIEADTLAAGGSNVTKGRLNFRLVTTGAAIVTPLQLYTQQVSIPQAPIGSAVRALLQLGSGPFTFGGSPPAGTFNSIATGTVLGMNEVAGFTGNLLDAQINGLSRFRISSTADHRAQVYDTTNAAVTALSVVHRFTTGTPSAGFGVALDFVGDNSIGSLATYAEINASATSTSAGSEAADLVFLCVSAERMRIKGSTQDINTSGQFQAVGGLCAGSTTTKSAVVDIRRPGASNPTQAQLTSLRVLGPSDTAVGTANDPVDVQFLLNRTVQLATQTWSNLRAMEVIGPTYAAVGASSATLASTVFINGEPTAGANMTLPNRYALYVNGAVRIDTVSQGFTIEFQPDTTVPTTLVGRIPIKVNGIIRYLGYYS